MSDTLISVALADAVADDLETFALLHDRELTAAVIAELRQIGFPDNLGFRPPGERARQAFELMEHAVRSLPVAGGEAVADRLLDEFAADYAAIYLNGSLGASPYESVWVSDDHLACQDAMFQLRDLYAAHGLQSADWRRRFDDHLVLQLQFLARAVRQARSRDEWRHLARVLDDHLLRWLDDFAQRVAARCDTPFYAGLVLLTAAHIDGLREVLVARLDEARPSKEAVDERCRIKHQPEAVPVAFMPGTAGPSW